MTRFATLGLPIACLLATACSKGGDEFKQTGEVKLPDETYNYVYLGAGSSMPFPLTFVDSKDWVNEGTMLFDKDSHYTLTQVGKSTVSNQDYLLSKNGQLTILNGQGSGATLRMPGFLAIDGDNFYFVRNTRPTSGTWPVLFFAGIKQNTAVPVMAGKWSHLGFSLYSAPKTATKTNDGLARTFEGTVTFDATNKVTAATWRDSSTANSTLTGQVTPKAGSEIDLVYAVASGLYTGTKSWSGFVGKDLAFLYDGSNKDADLGLAFMVREMAANADKSKLAGTYAISNMAMLSDGNLQGADIATGDLTFNLDNSFSITLTGPLGSFKYAGSFQIGANGRLNLDVTDNNQKWFAAVTPDYKTVVIVDGTWEKTTPELGFYLGIRTP